MKVAMAEMKAQATSATMSFAMSIASSRALIETGAVVHFSQRLSMLPLQGDNCVFTSAFVLRLATTHDTFSSLGIPKSIDEAERAHNHVHSFAVFSGLNSSFSIWYSSCVV